MLQPAISVIITTYNRVSLLSRAVDSALHAGNNVEVVVVDDASIDGTEEYCRARSDIRYVRLNKNVKTASARNAGVEASTAPYIAFLDDDDERICGGADIQLALLEKEENAVMAYGRFYQIIDRDTPWAEPVPTVCPVGDIYEELLKLNFICLSSTLVRRSAFVDVGGFDTSSEMYGIEDWDMWLRLSQHGQVCAVPDAVAVYRMPIPGSGQWSSDVTAQFSRVALAYKKKWLQTERAEALINSGRISPRRLLENVSDRILHDMYANSPNITEKLKTLAVAVKSYPQNVTRPVFYKTMLRAISGY